MTIPNILTVMRLILTPFFAIYLLRETPQGLWIASAIFVIAALTDTADGYLARKMGAETKIGQILDPLADKLLVALAYVSFLVLELPSVKTWMVGIILAREVLVTAFRSFAGRRGVTILSSPLAKWKTTFQMVLVFVLLALMSYRAMSDPAPAHWKNPGDPLAGALLYGALVVTTLITLLSGLDYFWKNRSLLKGSA